MPLFNPFTFIYNPPETVNSDIPVHPNSSTTAATSVYSQEPRPSKDNSLSSQLINKFNNLAETSKYLQDIIKLRTGNISVSIDPEIEPQVIQALQTLYGTAPTVISVAMYSNLLDMDINAQLTQASLGPNSTSQINQVQLS